MSQYNRRAFDMAMRADFSSFVAKVFSTINPTEPFLPTWYIYAICWHLEQVCQGNIRRLIICLPPRSLKSIIASVALPAWILGHDPSRKIISLTYNNELAGKYSIDFRRIITSAWYRRTYPGTIVSPYKDTETETQFTRGGSRLGTTLTGTITGRGASLILCDDPMKSQDAYSDLKREAVNEIYRSTVLSRLDNKKTGGIVIVMQRQHANDLVGSLLEMSGERFTVLSLPAIATKDENIQIGDQEFHLRKIGDVLHPEREPLEVLRGLELEMGPSLFASQYQQEPAAPGGEVIKKEWIQYYDELPPGGYYFISWDTAGKDGPRNSFSVGTVWYRKKLVNYFVDVVRGRFDYPTLCETAINLVKRYKPRIVLIEDASTGVSLQADIRRGASCRVELVPVVGDKTGRLYLQQGKFASGLVRFPKDKPFMAELLNELLRFPQSRHTDQVDSISQALAYVGSTYTLDNIS